VRRGGEALRESLVLPTLEGRAAEEEAEEEEEEVDEAVVVALVGGARGREDAAAAAAARGSDKAGVGPVPEKVAEAYLALRAAFAILEASGRPKGSPI